MESRAASGPSGALLIVGAGGFIGSAVARAALAMGHRVIAVCTGPAWRLTELPDDGRVTTVHAPPSGWWDRQFIADISPHIADAAAVAHLAYTKPADGTDALAGEREVNVAGTSALAEFALRTRKRVTFASSADCYGPWFAEPVSESQAAEPVTPYALAKLEAERQLTTTLGDDAVILRLGTVYGPGEDGPRAIPSFIRAFLRGEPQLVHGDGSDVKDYVHVDDVAKAIVEASFSPNVPRLMNIGSGIGRSTREILAMVAKAMGREETEARYVPSPRSPSRLVLDVELARESLPLPPTRPMPEALLEQVEWLRRRLGAGVAA
jgi:UDP-glucose 4-epimerase